MTDTSTTTDAKMNERNEQTMNDIKSLQTQEMNLYTQINNSKITPEQKEQLLKKINEISQMRLNMYNTIQQMYSSAQNNATETTNVLDQQMSAIKIIENELNASKRRLNLIEAQKNNKIRLVEINTYYGKQYDFYKNMMKIIVFTCIPIIILSVLGNKGIIPDSVNTILVGLVIVVGCVMFGYQLIDLANRDNMNFDEYKLYFDKTAEETSDSTEEEGTEEEDPWAEDVVTCVGADCCDPTLSKYDEAKNFCVPLNSQTTTTTTTTTEDTETTEESMTSGYLTRSYNIKKLGGYKNNWKAPRPANAMGLNNYARI